MSTMRFHGAMAEDVQGLSFFNGFMMTDGTRFIG